MFERLFKPGRIGKLTVKNRLVMVPLTLGYTEYPYNFTKQYIDMVEERARGGVGLIITAHVKAESEIDPYPIGSMPAALDRDYNLKNFAELAEVAHRHGALIVVQLSAGTGRYADMPMAQRWPAAPSPAPILRNAKLSTRELTLSEISGLVEAYGKAAEKAKRVGFDGVLVHCSGSYLIGQFLNPGWNKRTDKYGGTLENRMRFMEECIESIRSRAGSDLTLLAKITTNHMMEGGPPIEEAKAIARRLEELGIAAMMLSAGSYEAMDWLMPPIYYPPGCKLPHLQPVKDTLNVPFILDGRIDTPEFAEKLLEEGKTDFVGLGRPLLADPEWPKKVEEGRIADIRKCICCNECTSRIFSSRYAKCSVNPALGREKEYRFWPATTPKKVIVVGGGPGGLRSATVAASRGHKVTLYDKGDKLGGTLLAASAPDFKASMRPAIDWLAREARKAGVQIELGKEATAATIRRMKPDVVVLATGGVPSQPDIPGIRRKNVATAIDVLLGKAAVGNKVVVVGGGMIGCETALHLARMSKKVTLVEMLPDIAADAGVVEKMALPRLLAESKVSWHTGMKLDSITEEGAVACNAAGQRQLFRADTVVLAMGMKANDKLYKELEGQVSELLKIGDALQPRKVIDAIHEGEATAGLF